MSVNGTAERKAGDRLRLELLGGFRLIAGRAPVATSLGSERLLAFVALHPPVVRRTFTAGSLWPNVRDGRSYASLRSALTRLDSASRLAIEVSPLDLSLASGVHVDFSDARALAHRIVERTVLSDPQTFDSRAIATLSGDLLPGWYEEWVLIQAEDWRQLRLHALETLSGRLAAIGRFSDAATAASAAVHADPLRESARAAVIGVHLAEGNQFDAVREFKRYESLLHDELGVRPTRRLRELIVHLVASSPHGDYGNVSA